MRYVLLTILDRILGIFKNDLIQLIIIKNMTLSTNARQASIFYIPLGLAPSAQPPLPKMCTNLKGGRDNDAKPAAM